MDGSNVSFKVGTSSYSGTLKDDRIELQRTTDPRMQMPHPAEPEGPRPAIGPPPDGSDPSRNPNMLLPPDRPAGSASGESVAGDKTVPGNANVFALELVMIINKPSDRLRCFTGWRCIICRRIGRIGLRA